MEHARVVDLLETQLFSKEQNVGFRVTADREEVVFFGVD